MYIFNACCMQYFINQMDIFYEKVVIYVQICLILLLDSVEFLLNPCMIIGRNLSINENTNGSCCIIVQLKQVILKKKKKMLTSR